jgi:hypothetical protein
MNLKKTSSSRQDFMQKLANLETGSVNQQHLQQLAHSEGGIVIEIPFLGIVINIP